MKIRNTIQLLKHYGEDKTGYISDDTAFSDLAMFDKLLLSRAAFLKQYKGQLTDAMLQTISCVMFEEVDASECGLMPKSGCKIMKSTCNIPNIIKLISVSSQLGNESYDIVRWDQLQGKLSSRIKSIQNATYASVRNIGGEQYLYLINNTERRNAVIVGVFEDIVKAESFCDLNKTAICDPMEIDFYTDLAIQNAIFQITWSEIMQLRNTAILDVQNNDAVG